MIPLIEPSGESDTFFDLYHKIQNITDVTSAMMMIMPKIGSRGDAPVVDVIILAIELVIVLVTVETVVVPPKTVVVGVTLPVHVTPAGHVIVPVIVLVIPEIVSVITCVIISSVGTNVVSVV